jgi:type I restriction enzyme M protein
MEKNHLQNLFCKISDLDSEADVEALFIERLLTKLRYPDNRVCRKDAIEKFTIGRGSKKELYKPDYILLDSKKKPVIVIDAKAPKETPRDFLYQVSGYALTLNQKYGKENPVKYVILTNAITTLVYSWDKNIPLLNLAFVDVEEDNTKFVELRSMLSYGALEMIEATEDVFIFEPPDLDSLIKIFDECHNKIWKMEKLGPTDAFYEFVKIMFVKLREDHRIAGIIAKGIKPKFSDFNFSVAWIQEQVDKGVSDNPLASILFSAVRNVTFPPKTVPVAIRVPAC